MNVSRLFLAFAEQKKVYFHLFNFNILNKIDEKKSVVSKNMKPCFAVIKVYQSKINSYILYRAFINYLNQVLL